MNAFIALLFFVWLFVICSKEETDKRKAREEFKKENPPIRSAEEFFLEWYFFLRFRAVDKSTAYENALNTSFKNTVKAGFRPEICKYPIGIPWEMSKVLEEARKNNGVPIPINTQSYNEKVREEDIWNCRMFGNIPIVGQIERMADRDYMTAQYLFLKDPNYGDDLKLRYYSLIKLLNSFGITDEELKEDYENLKSQKVNNHEAKKKVAPYEEEINQFYATWLKEQDRIDPNYEASEFVYIC